MCQITQTYVCDKMKEACFERAAHSPPPQCQGVLRIRMAKDKAPEVHTPTASSTSLLESMMAEEDDLVSRNFQIVKTFKQRLKLSKRLPLKSEIKKREYITDARRTYSQMLLSTFNSCDLVKLSRVFELYCRPDLYAVSLYEGGKNPTGANSTELRSIPTLTMYWDALFKEVPDFLFESQFVTAYTDKASQIAVIRSKFRLTGTRLLDVKLVQKSNGSISKKKLLQELNVVSADAAKDTGVAELDGDAEYDDIYLDDLILLASDPNTSLYHDTCSNTEAARTVVGEDTNTNTHKRKSSARSAAAELKAQTKAEEKAAAKRAKVDAAKVTSLFASGMAVTFNEDTQIYTDKPLAESLELKYRGTFTVYLDENSKIFRYEFIYTAEDVFLAAAEAATGATGGGTVVTESSGDSRATESILSGGEIGGVVGT